jgi:hypothetical protein
LWRRRLAGGFCPAHKSQNAGETPAPRHTRVPRPPYATLQKGIAGFAPRCSIVIVALCPVVIVLGDGDRPLMSKQTGPPVSETAASTGTTQVFRPYERLVEIKVLGKAFQVPEKNTILRCFQYISPETIPYGRFCWNQDCQYCRVVGKLTDEDRPHELLSCKFLVSAGMDITEISPELKYCLQNKLGK